MTVDYRQLNQFYLTPVISLYIIDSPFEMNPKVFHHLDSNSQKQLFSFFQSQNPGSLDLPSSLRESNLHFPWVILTKIIPMMQQFSTGIKQKQLISDILERAILDSPVFLCKLQTLCTLDHHETMDIQGEKVSFSTCLLKLIALPGHYLNLISETGLEYERKINIANLEAHKRRLYIDILKASRGQDIEQRLLVINKMIVLGYHQVFVEECFGEGEEKLMLCHFEKLSKSHNIVKFLYSKIIDLLDSKRKEDQHRLETFFISLANEHPQLTSSSFISLLNGNNLSLFQGLRYIEYHKLISRTKIKQNIVKELLKWWSVGRNYIVTANHSKFRCNLLCLFLRDFKKEQLIHSDFPVSIIEGIKKRLTDGSSKDYALLVWKCLSEVIDLPVTEQVKKAQFFIVQGEVVEKIQKKQQVELRQEKKIEDKVKDRWREEKVEKDLMDSATQDEEIVKQQTEQDGEIIKIQPKNLYDCILGLRNPQRLKITLQKLPYLIKNHKEDLVLMWNSLLETLLKPLQEEYKAVLVLLFTTRPEDFIEALTFFFMNRETNISQKIWLMQTLNEGIESLSQMPVQDSKDQDQPFYFKKVKSTYYKQTAKRVDEQQQKEREQRVRRWGHTRIAHEQKSKGVNLNILRNQSSINRFYPVANMLYYKVIDILSIDVVNSLRKHQVYVQHLLRLLSNFTSSIKNHFEKSVLLFDVSSVCVRVVEELLEAKEQRSNRYQESGGQTLMLCLQVVNKISLVLDQFASEGVMSNLKKIIEGSRRLPNYGMNSILDMIEGNIYRAVYQQ